MRNFTNIHLKTLWELTPKGIQEEDKKTSQKNLDGLSAGTTQRYMYVLSTLLVEYFNSLKSRLKEFSLKEESNLQVELKLKNFGISFITVTDGNKAKMQYVLRELRECLSKSGSMPSISYLTRNLFGWKILGIIAPNSSFLRLSTIHRSIYSPETPESNKPLYDHMYSGSTNTLETTVDVLNDVYFSKKYFNFKHFIGLLTPNSIIKYLNTSEHVLDPSINIVESVEVSEKYIKVFYASMQILTETSFYLKEDPEGILKATNTIDVSSMNFELELVNKSVKSKFVVLHKPEGLQGMYILYTVNNGHFNLGGEING